jgi:hypothetical protein
MSQKFSTRSLRETAVAEDTVKNYRFGSGLGSEAALVSGWGQPETGFVWSEGHFAELKLPVSEGKYQISLGIWGYAPGDDDIQKILVFLNGVLAGYYQVKEKTLITVPYVQAEGGDSDLKISIYIPDAKSPKAAERVPDERMLGIALASVAIEQVT